MLCVIVENEAEFERALAAAEEKGLRIAALSNAGLETPRCRLTFLPADCFKSGDEREPMDVSEFLKDDMPPMSGKQKSELE